MPRKKTRKSPHQSKTNTLETIQKKEKEFLNTPAALSTLLNKEAKTIKQKEFALKKSISQLTTQITNFEKRPQTNTKV